MKITKLGVFALLLTWSAPLQASAVDGVALDAAAFPDPAFLSWVQRKDSDQDGFLSQDELDAVTDMDLRDQSIADLDGLGWFRNLTRLNCSENELTALVLPELPALTTLTCNENADLSELDLRGVPALQNLSCFHSNLSELDLTVLPDLQYLAWGGSLLDALNLRENPELSSIHILGGELDQADLSQNPKLDTLLWNYTRIQTLDLSNQPDLTFLNCTDNHLVALDLSEQTALQAVHATNNQLAAVRMPDGVDCLTDLSAQRTLDLTLEPGQNSIPLTDLAAWMDADKISALQGATLQDGALHLEQPNVQITYLYTDGPAVVDAILQVSGENGWQTPLSIADWTYGQSPSQPQAAAAFGEVTFSYGPTPQGPFSPAPPTQAGTWYVQATVADSAQYAGLEAVASFHIRPAAPEYMPPAAKQAVYRDLLSSVALEAGFFWEQTDAYVGDAGEQIHLARFVPDDPTDYLTVEHIPVTVAVAPYDGTRLPIPDPITQQQAEQLAIYHDTQRLQSGQDYLSQIQTQGSQGTLTIRFQGNYAGTVTRTFPVTDPDGETPEPPSGGSTGGTIHHPESSSSTSQTARLILLQPTHGTLSAKPDEPSVGDTVRIALIPACGYQAQSIQAVNARGDTVTIREQADGTYLLRMPAGTVTVSAIIQPIAYETPFVDVSPESWYASAVGMVYEQGWMIGTDATHFFPDAPLDRGMLLTILHRQAGSPSAGPSPFADTPADSFDTPAIAWGAEQGLIQGTAPQTFAPRAPLTCEQLVTILWQQAGSPPAARFPDTDLVSDWARSAWAWAIDQQLFAGLPDDLLAPNRTVTRGEAALYLANASAC